MTHDVVVGQQVDREKEAKEKTKRLVITLGAIFLLIFGCIASCLVFGILAPGTGSAPVVHTPTSIPVGQLAPGIHIVGEDIQPGTYRGQAGSDVLESCYWARLSALDGELGSILANDNAIGQFYIEVKGTDFALETGCTLERVSD